MLNRLSIKNVALIENAEIDFSDGLNVMSGETGSGKSVIIESLNFVLGAKADKSLIRSGTEFCSVAAEFDVKDNVAIKSLYEELDFEQDDLLIVSRKLSADGKNSVKVNGNGVNLSMLKRFTSKLVDVHGQSEHYELLNENNQLKLLDYFAGEKVFLVKEKIKTVRAERESINKELEALGGDESQRLLRLDVLDYQIKEIEDCDLKENEESELLILKEKLRNQEKIAAALLSLKSALIDEGGVSDILGNASRAINGISSLGAEYSELYDRVSALYAEAEDVSETANNLLEESEYAENDADKVEERLETIKSVKRKYGENYNEICVFLSNAKAEREKLANFNELAENLLKRKSETESILYKEYGILSDLRKKASLEFSDKVSRELKELGMDKAAFKVEFSAFPKLEDCTFASDGADSVRFLFSANYGEPLKPLSGVISGGEMSRFMLAIKAQSAKYDGISTYIFDEIDAGISGKTASVVAEKLYKISLGVQVIAITHLPQIAAFSDNAVYVSKIVENEKTTTKVKTLSEKEKLNEVIRLVGGSEDSAAAKKHSEVLISEADKIKIRIKEESK